jgi:hypothetical protein
MLGVTIWSAARLFPHVQVRYGNQPQVSDWMVRWAACLVRTWFADHSVTGSGPDEPEQSS